MLPQLLVTAGPDQGRTFSLDLGEGPALFGRSKAHTGHQIKDPQVSRVHFQIEEKDGRILLTDLSSSGTCVNGRKVTEEELRHGDVVRAGETQMRFQVSTGDSASEEGRAAETLPQPLSELAGQILSHYRVGDLVAKATSGCVFRAIDVKTDHVVALKVLWPELSRNDEEMQRFVRAMKTMLPMRHPNLVMVCGAGRTGPLCWMAMEYVEGESVAQIIQRLGSGGRLDWHQALRVGVHIARALNYAQQQRIVHRNITPTNILVRRGDQVALLGDLMLAKALEGTLAEQITRSGQLVGDVAYMSPERTRGEADNRSDIYSLGATVYALLTGKPPFEGLNLAETVAQIRQTEPRRPRLYQTAVPEELEGVVLKMLAKRPEERYQTAAELLATLERLAKLHSVSV